MKALYVWVSSCLSTLLHIFFGTMSERWLPISDLIVGTLTVFLIGSAFAVMSAAGFWLGAIRGSDLRTET